MIGQLDTAKPTGKAAQNQVINFFKEAKKLNKKVCVGIDLDQTVVHYNKDPRLCKIDAVCHDALSKIAKVNGAPLIITGRDGWRAQQLVNIPEAVVIGTYGYEARVDNDSYVYEKIFPYRNAIIYGLLKIRELFLQRMGLQVNVNSDREFEIQIPENGKIVVERKALGGIFLDENKNTLSGELTEGLAHVYNCNAVSPVVRKKIAGLIQQAYNEIIDEIVQKEITTNSNQDKNLLHSYKANIQRYLFLKSQNNSPELPGDYSIEIGPEFEESKAHVILQFLNEANNSKREKYLSHIPTYAQAIFYEGDSNSDAAVFKAGKNIEENTKGKINFIGVWVIPPNAEKQNKAREECTVAVNGISENGELLTKIADLLSANNI